LTSSTNCKKNFFFWSCPKKVIRARVSPMGNPSNKKNEINEWNYKGFQKDFDV